MNLVLVVSDTFRWDYIGAYGNRWIRTPNLDALAAESALFLDAYAEGLPTINARRVLMTGRNIVPFEYRPQKADSIQAYGWHPLYDEDVTLSEHLRANGYFTAFFNDVYHLMKPGKNFHRGFDQWFWIRGQEADPYGLPDRARVEEMVERYTHGQVSEVAAIPLGVVCDPRIALGSAQYASMTLQGIAAQATGEQAFQRDNSDRAWLLRHFVLRKKWKSDADTSVGQTMSAAADWVRDYTLEQPFYLHVECFDPHEPWDPPPEYARLYEPNYGDSLDGCSVEMTRDKVTPAMFANIKAAYAGEVTLVDRWVGHLMRALKESGRLKDTLVVFTSDHGCMMGEQGEIHKGTDRLRNQVTRVPLLIRHPQGKAAGAKVTGFLQHQDIMPTVLGLLGQKPPERVLGRDAWGQTRGEPGAPDAVLSAFGEYASFRTAQWNLIMPWLPLPKGLTPSVQLYDLAADPQELTNVVTKHRPVAEGLSKRLREQIARFAPLTSGSFQAKSDNTGSVSLAALPTLDQYL